MQRSPRALDHASVLPRTVVSIIQSSVLGTSCWGDYAQCARSAVGHHQIQNVVCKQLGLQELLKHVQVRCWRDCCFSKNKKIIIMDRKFAVGWGPASGCARHFSSVRSARFATQRTLGCCVPDWDNALMILDSALSPVIWSPQFPATSTTAQNVSRHKQSQFAGTCWPNL